VHQGKIRYIGTSTFEPSAIVEGQWIAERRGRERVVAEQPPYSILARGVEREVLPIAQKYGLVVIPWSPLAGGWLEAAQARLAPDVLDEIDKIVPPGVTLSARDQGYRPPALTDPARRRRG